MDNGVISSKDRNDVNPRIYIFTVHSNPLDAIKFLQGFESV